MEIPIAYFQGLGDMITLGRLFKDVKEQRPDVKILLSAPFKELWKNNSTVAYTRARTRGRADLRYYAYCIDQLKQGKALHHMKGLYDLFNKQTGLNIKLTQPKGYVETATMAAPLDGRYWVVMSGGKKDMATKWWSGVEMQRVVNYLRSHGITVVQCGAFGQNPKSAHFHHRLSNVLRLVGQTQNEVEFLNTIKHAEGVICGVTAAMHMAAAFDKPCVVIAGGREPVALYGYNEKLVDAGCFGPDCGRIPVSHEILHTIGRLNCCSVTGCNMSNLESTSTEYLCKKILTVDSMLLPECMHMIKAEHVVSRIQNYVSNGIIPPIDKAPPVVSLPLITKTEALVINNKTVEPEQPPTRQQLIMPDTNLAYPGIAGDKMTVLVLCYGEYTSLARRCLNSIINTVPASKLDLRVAANQCVPDTLAYLQSLPLTKLYVSTENRRKYPVLRDMLRDPECPIVTPYFCWFDDDSHVRDKTWLDSLNRTIDAHHPKMGRMYGWIHWCALSAGGSDDTKLMKAQRPLTWFRQAAWWKDQPLWVNFKTRAPNGTKIRFIPGSFWALHYETAIACDVPDIRLSHNGGDVTIGAQVEQNGFELVQFNANKNMVAASDYKRRGVSDKFPWVRM